LTEAVERAQIIATIILLMHGLLTVYGFLEISTKKPMHRDFVIVISTISKYLTLIIVAILFFAMINTGEIDKYLNRLFDVMFIYLGPWAIHSAAIEFYYEDELVLKDDRRTADQSKKQ
jgi:hypothetical protein